MKKYNKYTRYIFMGMIVILIGVGISGCGKKKVKIPVLNYQVNDDDTVSILGLTDKGKTDETIKIPSTIEDKNVISIESEAFRDNQNVNQIIIEEGITKIGANAFYNCGNLDKIQFPSTLTDVGMNVVKDSLYEKNMLESEDQVVINQILVSIKKDITNYQIPDQVKSIAPGLFYQNQTITEVKCSDGLKNIGAYAFSGCTALTKITLPKGIEKVGYGAFSGCTNLSVTMPSQIQTIEPEAFDGVKETIYQ